MNAHAVRVAEGLQPVIDFPAVIRRLFAMALVTVACTLARPVAAAVLAVPAVIAQLQAPKEETHVLHGRDGSALGEQHFRAAVAGNRLTFDVATHFASGEEWDEHGTMGLADGLRSERFDKTVRRAGRVVQEQHVDFTNGNVAWLVDGVHAERTMTLAPDTYIGPMLALVLAGVPEREPAKASFEALVFRPDPVVVTLRAEAVGEDDPPLAPHGAAATKLRVKADLGAIKNVLFASLIPTHFFWFTRSRMPEFVGFEGKLSNGLEVVMTPETSPTTTAHAR